MPGFPTPNDGRPDETAGDLAASPAEREPVPEPTSEQLDALRRIGVWPPRDGTR